MDINLPLSNQSNSTGGSIGTNSILGSSIFYQPPSTTKLSDMINSTSILKISKALLEAQKNMGNASKDAKNPFYKSSYADLNSIREAVTPALHAQGIAVLQPTVVINGEQYVRTLLLHESGEYLGADTKVVVSKQNDPQALGSAISYARRYGLQSMLNVGAVDDDGEKAMSRANPPPQEPQKNTSKFRRPETPAVEEKKQEELPPVMREEDSWL